MESIKEFDVNEIEYVVDVLQNEVSRLKQSLEYYPNGDNVALVKTYVPQLYNAINMLRRHDKLVAEIKSLQCECNNLFVQCARKHDEIEKLKTENQKLTEQFANSLKF